MTPLKNIESADFQAGELILIDKPLTWTSFDVVNKVRYAVKRKLDVKKIKVGHSGTLDPMATGLLILCTGKYTKKLAELQGLNKKYTGVIKLGATTASYDSESDPENEVSVDHLSASQINEAKSQFEGQYLQDPPIFSAIKIKGQTAYKLARRGTEVKLDPREVEVFNFEITKIDLPYISFEVHCKKGFYVRSLANDFGKALGVGGYLHELRRITVGNYNVSDAWILDEFIQSMECQ